MGSSLCFLPRRPVKSISCPHVPVLHESAVTGHPCMFHEPSQPSLNLCLWWSSLPPLLFVWKLLRICESERMRGEPTTAVIIHRGAHCTNTVMLLLLTVIAAERVKDVSVCVLWLQERNYNIYLNHTSLLKAILLHSGIPEDKLSQASNILCDAMVSAGLTCITDVNLIACVSLMCCYECECSANTCVFASEWKVDQTWGGSKVLQLFTVNHQCKHPPGPTGPCVKIINPATANFFLLCIDFCPLLYPVANAI